MLANIIINHKGVQKIEEPVTSKTTQRVNLGILLATKRKELLLFATRLNQRVILSENTRYKRKYSLCFHLHKAQEQA